MELRMQDLTFDMGNDITAAVKLLKRPMLVGEYTRVMFQVRDRTKNTVWVVPPGNV